jgi:hypothetical protein
MKSLRTAQSILLVLLVAACGDTVELGGPPDGGEAGSRSTSSTTGSSGSGTTTSGTTTSGSGGSNGTTGAGGDTNTTGAGGHPGTTGAGGHPGTTSAGGSSNTGTGGSPGAGGAGGSDGGTVCGGLGGAVCPRGSYCDFEPSAMCGAADQTGICRQIPPVDCVADCPGVCGCDGKFYCNACIAHFAGTDDSTDRSCVKDGGPGSTCGGLRGAACSSDSFCHFDPAAYCGAADATGVCWPRPQVCPADCPGVCGCDGKFYCNACTAQSMGFDVSMNVSCLTRDH